MAQNPFIGKWCITEMEQWDSDYIDEEEDGAFEFGEEEQGDFHFGCVQGLIDYEIITENGTSRLDFSFDGNEEMDGTTGRGWARIENDGTMFGKIAFYMGERSWFKATREK